MSYEVKLADTFKRAFKRLRKKYHSLDNDLERLIAELELNPTIGTDLGSGIHKVRMALSDKGKGKSHGARVITHTAVVSVEEGVVTLLTIYDKNEQDSISKKEISRLTKELDK